MRRISENTKLIDLVKRPLSQDCFDPVLAIFDFFAGVV